MPRFIWLLLRWAALLPHPSAVSIIISFVCITPTTGFCRPSLSLLGSHLHCCQFSCGFPQLASARYHSLRSLPRLRFIVGALPYHIYWVIYILNFQLSYHFPQCFESFWAELLFLFTIWMLSSLRGNRGEHPFPFSPLFPHPQIKQNNPAFPIHNL